jgi:SAM-dependent methyltransferase
MFKKLVKRYRSKGNWARSEGGLFKREYRSYDEYVAHQKTKLEKINNLEKKRLTLKEALQDRLARIPEVRRGTNALCLGARLGGECEAFIDRGVFALGIDLNPGPSNRYVVTGDFHALQYSDSSTDAVYTNSLDHVFDLERVLAEVVRVLKPGGIFIAEIVLGSEDDGGRPPGAFEASWWKSTDALVQKIELSGLKARDRVAFTKPWNGIQAVFQKPA